MKYFSSVSGKSLKFFSVTSELFVVLFFVSIVDSDNTEIMENYSAEQLNSYDKFLTFKNRFQSKP